MTVAAVLLPPMGPEEVAERLEALADTYGTERPGPVAVVDGFGVRLRVERGALEVSDGVGPHRRLRRYDRATHELARVVVTGDGIVSTAALRWCKAAGVEVVVLDQAAEALLTSGRVANDDARLRRAQALALHTPAGLEVAKYLVSGKITGQAQVAATLLASPSTDETLARLLEDLDDAASLEEVQHVEAVAASAYFAAWGRLEVPFVGRDAGKVPAHWRRFNGRRSAVMPATARHATDPLNALLNFAYRLLEAEARLACLRVGLDPGVGVLHADMKGRDSLALDLLEVARPLVDRTVLELVQARRLRRRDFAEDGRGVVRVLAPLSHELAGHMASWGLLLAPAVEHVAELFAAASAYDVAVPSLLTGARHKDAARRRAAAERARAATTLPGPNPGGIPPRRAPRQRPHVEPSPRIVPACRGCGAVLPVPADRRRPVRHWCEGCLPERRAEIVPAMRAASEAAARATVAATGSRPSHTPEARAKRREANRLRRLAQLADGTGPASPAGLAWWRATLLPALRPVSLPRIATATGVSTSTASKWRRGVMVPSPAHWPALAELAGVALPSDGATA
jgi:CRISPR-associated protein Cas1